MATVEIHSKIYVDKRQRLRVVWNCKLRFLRSSTWIYLSGYFNPEYLAKGKDDFIEILANYKTDRDRFAEDRIFRSLDIVSVLRTVIKDMGLNPDGVAYKLMPAKEEKNNESKMDTPKGENKESESSNPEVY